MPRNSVMVRAFQMLQLMQGRRIRPTVPEIARALGVSERTAKRWIAALDEAHIPTPPTVKECV